MRQSKRLAQVAGLFFAFTTVGCATYQNKIEKSRQLMESGDSEKALVELKVLAEKPDGDQLVYLLDYASALQAAGKLEESTRVFLQADVLADQQDYHSVSRVAGSLLMSEEMKQYKGDTFEKIFINAELALNFLEEGKLDEALVEARRINEKYLKLRGEEAKKFELNPFAKYLSAVIWEADRKYDDAIIAYTETHKISSGIPGLPADLIRTAKLAHRDDEYKKWKKIYPEVQERPEWYDKKSGELVIIAQLGWGPRKVFSRGDARFPDLAPVRTGLTAARAHVEGVGTFDSSLVYDVESAAMQTLADDRLSLLGRRVVGLVAKDVATQELRRQNDLLGTVAWIAMQASDRADLRQWSTLPQEIQFIRIPLKAGTYKVRLEGLTYDGRPGSSVAPEETVQIGAGKKKFIVWRAFR